MYQSFVDTKRVLTFDEYVQLLWEAPRNHARSADQYLLDALDFWGRKDSKKGYKLFETPWGDTKSRVIGQEDAQESIYRLLRTFMQNGRANKVVMLVGPNGSSKSSIIASLMHGMETYSKTPEGSLYRFNWIFPVENIERERLGFAREEFKERHGAMESYALLDEKHIAAKIPCELRDNPLLLIPREERMDLLDSLKKSHPDFAELPYSDYVKNGDLAPKSRMIFDTLLNAYGGDLQRVLQHIQVERYEISVRYKQGAVVIEPEMSVDASLRQVSMDQRYNNLPPILKSISMFEPIGKLVDANHGIIEFSDMLKRPLDTFKYLLGTCEKGTINLDLALLDLDIFFMASTNDMYVEAFKKSPDFPSFRGRMEFIRVPYLYDYTEEQQIYDLQLRLHETGKSVAPHVSEIAAMWAVMTRMRKPEPEKYPAELRDVVTKFSPLDKARLYAGEKLEWPTESQWLLLQKYAKKMQREFSGMDFYEGSVGASPREGKQLILNAFEQASERPLTPVSVLGLIARMDEEKGLHQFLQAPSDGDFMNHPRIHRLLLEHYIYTLDFEVKTSLSLVEPSRYEDMFRRYVLHVSAYIKGEKIYNTHTKDYDPPNEQIMASLEEMIGIPDTGRVDFRNSVLTRIAVHSLDNRVDTETELQYRKVFEKEIELLEQNYYHSQKEVIRESCEAALSLLTEEAPKLSYEAKQAANKLIDGMVQQFYYPRDTLPEVLNFLLKNRY